VLLKPFVYQEMSVTLCRLTWSGNDVPRCFYTCRMNCHRLLFSLDSSADGISYGFEFHIVDFEAVSNFNVGQVDELFRVPDGDRCATNQVPYSLNDRGIEHDLLPWCKSHGLPVMAYSPLGGDNELVIGDPTRARIDEAHGSSASAVAFACFTAACAEV
jgi:hypothetical protein